MAYLSRTLHAETYVHDANGNRTTLTVEDGGSPQVTTYGYDVADRLISEVSASRRVLDRLDAAGNRVDRLIQDGAGVQQQRLVYTVNARDQVTGIETRNGADAVTGTEVLVYDANGNRIGRSVGGVTQTHVYDRRNRELASGSVRYEHNDADVRTATVDGALRTDWVMDGLALQAEVRGGTTVAHYREGRELIGEVRGSAGRTILSDGHRSPVVVLESTGNVTDRVRYSAGGEVRERTGSSPLAFGYGGYLTQSGTEELYAFARTYSPGLARFNEVDPLRSFDSLLGMGSHRYVLGYGNPIRYVDPDGRIAFLSDAENYLRDTTRGYDGSIDRAVSEGSTSRAFGYGVGKGLVSAGRLVVGGLNTASNLLAQNLYDGETYAQARTELDANEAAAVEVIEGSVALGGALKNDFGGTVARGGQAVGRFARDVKRGDPRAWASLGEMAGEGLGGAPAGAWVGRGAGRLATRTSKPITPRVIVEQADGDVGTGRPGQNPPERQSGCCHCFVAGTQVSTPGGLVAIEDLRIGDRVWSKSETSGEISAEAVEALHENAVEEIHALTTETADGGRETIELTSKHPYWVVGTGWLDSGALKPGMVLLSAEGGEVRVVGLRPLGRVQTTYNLTIANHESYFVGEQQIWVHNCPIKCEGDAGNERVEIPRVDLAAVEGLAPGVYRGNPNDIRFGQHLASPNFSTGGTINDTVAELRAGKSPDLIGSSPIRVVFNGGIPYTLDNRRLVAFNAAGVEDIPFQVVAPNDPEIARLLLKPSRMNPIAGEGRYIVIAPAAEQSAARKLLLENGLIRR